MLSREDSRRLAELERQLRRDDPEFCARMSGGLPEPQARRRAPLSLIFTAAVIWLAAIALGVLGWWPAAVLTAAVATVVVAAVIYRLRTSENGTLPGPGDPWGIGKVPGGGNTRDAGGTPGTAGAWDVSGTSAGGDPRDGGDTTESGDLKE